MWMFYVGN